MSRLPDIFFNHFIFPELWPLKIWAFNTCQQDNSKTFGARRLKLGQLIGDDK